MLGNADNPLTKGSCPSKRVDQINIENHKISKTFYVLSHISCMSIHSNVQFNVKHI
jgi:hypothetical protein